MSWCTNGNNMNQHLIQILKNKKILFKQIENVLKAFFIQQVTSQNSGNQVSNSKRSNKVVNWFLLTYLRKILPMESLSICKIQ